MQVERQAECSNIRKHTATLILKASTPLNQWRQTFCTFLQNEIKANATIRPLLHVHLLYALQIPHLLLHHHPHLAYTRNTAQIPLRPT